jgi:hypothetical protein
MENFSTEGIEYWASVGELLPDVAEPIRNHFKMVEFEERVTGYRSYHFGGKLFIEEDTIEPACRYYVLEGKPVAVVGPHGCPVPIRLLPK